MTTRTTKQQLAEARAEIDQLHDLLGSIWLYIHWRYVTRQLTTEQKVLFADAVDSGGGPVADRWWVGDGGAS